MIYEMFKEAIRSLMYNKMRSFLSMLGIVIGVMAVIIVLSLGNGATYSVKSEIESIGSNVFFVMAKRTKYGKLTLDDIEEMKRQAMYLTDITPSFSSNGNFKYAENTISTQFYATNPDFINIFGLKVESGRLINELEFEGGLKVAVIGSYVAEELFGEEDPLGKEIKLYINNRFLPLKVVGVLEETGSKLFLNVDNVVFIPFTTVEQRLLKLDTVNQFFAKAKNSEVVEQAKDELEIFLFSRLKDEDSYKILSQDEILDTINQVTGMLNLVLGAIAGISLLVGGIGIMNIMLVSVTERTREIGIKKAIGATNSNIMLQFLIESSILTVSAGIIGVIMGMVFSNFIGKFINVTPHFRVDQIILSFVISGLIGLFFGIYPAIKASKLNPVDALRYE